MYRSNLPLGDSGGQPYAMLSRQRGQANNALFAIDYIGPSNSFSAKRTDIHLQSTKMSRTHQNEPTSYSPGGR